LRCKSLPAITLANYILNQLMTEFQTRTNTVSVNVDET
jgi:hypothetical protein